MGGLGGVEDDPDAPLARGSSDPFRRKAPPLSWRSAIKAFLAKTSAVGAASALVRLGEAIERHPVPRRRIGPGAQGALDDDAVAPTAEFEADRGKAARPRESRRLHVDAARRDWRHRHSR